MSGIHDTYDDEIDLFELFEILWGGKWLIVGCTLLVASMGFGYSQLIDTRYEASVPYVVNIYSVGSQQTCDGSVGCMENEAIKRLSVFLEDGWKASGGATLTLAALEPPEADEAVASFERINALVTAETYSDAKTELAWIESELSDALLGTETLASNILNAKRVIASIDDGQSVFTFGAVTISERSAPVLKITILTSVLGGMVGVFFVFIQNAIQTRKQQVQGKI